MKKRLDILTAEKGLAPSREKAKALIMAGQVFVNGEREDKAGTLVPEDSKIEIIGKGLPYVSRGGLKLEKAVNEFEIDLESLICMDAGCSTGGFTDCMLQNGASKVYAVDVGYGQLDWKLRNDSRVVCMEKTNARYLKPGDIADELDFLSADLSFISLKKVLPALKELLKDGAGAVVLIKPQFEAGREKVGKKGVVRDPSVHIEVIKSICDFVSCNGWLITGLTYSPVRGPEGNIEYLLYMKKNVLPDTSLSSPYNIEDLINSTVRSAHSGLSGGST